MTGVGCGSLRLAGCVGVGGGVLGGTKLADGSASIFLVRSFAVAVGDNGGVGVRGSW